MASSEQTGFETLEADVAIVGAGPGGTATAVALGQYGVGKVVLLDRTDFPRDKTCGSGLSPRGIRVLKDLDVWSEVEREAYWIKGLRLVTPGDQEVFLSGGDTAAAAICHRRTLDHVMQRRALATGVKFVPHFNARTLEWEGSRVAGVRSAEGQLVRARYVVVADGAHSRFTVDRSPKQMMQAIMGWWDDVPFTPHHVEMVFDRMVSPLYGWLFPEGPRRVNIGICYETTDKRVTARDLFKRFLDKHYGERLRGATQCGDFKGHPIVYSYDLPALHSPGRIVIGEAGRMTHPATGEGISQAMRSGVYAAEALRDVLLRGVAERDALERYETRCRRSFEWSFKASKVWRSLVDSSALEWVARLGSSAAFKRATGQVMARM